MARLSITLVLEAAQAEALSETLLEAGADSVDLEPGVALARITALAARRSDPHALIASAARAAGIAAPGSSFHARQIEDEDWVHCSQAQFGPIRAGTNLWIVPNWHTRPGGRVLLAGILETQAEEVAAAYAKDFDSAPVAREEGWALVEGTRR